MVQRASACRQEPAAARAPLDQEVGGAAAPCLLLCQDVSSRPPEFNDQGCSSGAEQEASERLPAPLPSWQAAAADAMQPQDAPLGEEGSEVGRVEAVGCRDAPACAPSCAADDTVLLPLPAVWCRVDGAAPAFSVPAHACTDGEQECKEGSRAAAGQLSLPEVSAEVFEAVPTFKRLNLTHGELNDTIAKLNDYLSQKRHEEHARSAGQLWGRWGSLPLVRLLAASEASGLTTCFCMQIPYPSAKCRSTWAWAPRARPWCCSSRTSPCSGLSKSTATLCMQSARCPRHRQCLWNSRALAGDAAKVTQAARLRTTRARLRLARVGDQAFIINPCRRCACPTAGAQALTSRAPLKKIQTRK